MCWCGLGRIGALFAPSDQQGDVVALFVRTELANLVDKRSQQTLRRQVPVLAQGFNQTRFAEFFAVRVERLGDTVGVENQGVSGKEIPLTRTAIPPLEKSQYGAGRIKPLQIAVPAKQKRWKMTAVCIAQATQAVVVLSEKECGKSAIGGILVKKPMYRE